MGCEFSKLYNLEIHLENDLGIFEPLDVVAGHVLIQVENDTTIHREYLWGFCAGINRFLKSFLCLIQFPYQWGIYLRGWEELDFWKMD